MKTLFLCFLSLMLLAGCNEKKQAESSADPLHRLSIVTKDGKRHDFTIELAETPEARQMGLMNRTEMAKDAGMMFFFSDFVERSFWMKNTLIPLDMIFINEEGVITHIHDSAIPNDLTSIKSDGPARAVLEVNGGVSKQLGLGAGDQVHHLYFGNDF